MGQDVWTLAGGISDEKDLHSRDIGEEDLKISFTSTTVVTPLQPLLWTAFILA